MSPERVESEASPESSQPIEHLSTREGYDRWAMIYDDEDNPLIMLEERHLPDLLGDVHGLDVVDLGCGTGRRSVRLVAAGAPNRHAGQESTRGIRFPRFLERRSYSLSGKRHGSCESRL